MNRPTERSLLDHSVPDDQATRVLLAAMRRMAVGGLDDAEAQATMLGLFGLGYRRPLILLRLLMATFARTARHQIAIAPACCHRMTCAERTMLETVCAPDERRAKDAAARLLGTGDCAETAVAAQALAQAFADLGRPLAS